MRAIKLLAFFGVAVAVLLQAPVASAREFGDIYTDCGLGALIAPHTPVVAAVTNVTWDLGTTAILSNYSSPDTCQGGKAKTASLIFEAYPSVEHDIAVGRGDHLDALLTLANCGTSDTSQVVADLRNGFAVLVAQPDYSSESRYQKAEGLYGLLNSVVQRNSGSASCTLS